MTSVFSARGVSVSFGGVRAVAGVDLDEPAAGLDALQSRELGRLLPGIAAAGTALLIAAYLGHAAAGAA